MNTEPHHIEVAGLNVEVVRKRIKHLHLSVHPPEGGVRVAAPLQVDDEAVRLAVITRLAWIKRQQRKFLTQVRLPERQYVSGESHYYLGRRYRLNTVYADGRERVVRRNGSFIDLYVGEGASAARRERLLIEWYRKELKALIPPLLEKWAQRMGLEVPTWGVKRMKTKWGTCNAKARRIWLNLELMKKPQLCLEYVIVHELVHLLERHHSDRFHALMDKYMPQWRTYRDELNAQPLSHEVWGC